MVSVANPRRFSIAAVTDSTVCDHLRATELFKYSIKATEHSFNAYKCESWDKFQVSSGSIQRKQDC